MEIHTSTVNDGSMKSPDRNFATVLPIRSKFLDNHGIRANQTTLVQVTYESDDFCRYYTVDSPYLGDGITRPSTLEADALVTTQPGHSLFLPLADCIGAVIHDQHQNILMLSHLGRHNLEQQGGTRSVEYLSREHNSAPANLKVWLSPAAGATNYPLYSFDNRSLHDVATEQLTAAGIPIANITSSPIDSSQDPNYYSHSQFLAGHRDTDGRFAVAAILLPAA